MNSQKNILLLEDDPILGESLREAMANAGFVVDWKKNIEEAGESLQTQSPDLLISDVDLPDGNGIDFVGAVREAGHEFPIIVLTAFSGEHFVIKALEAGANDYLRKPLGNKELVARIQVHLRGSQQVKVSELEFDKEQRSMSLGSRVCYFNSKQIALLETLYNELGKIVKRSDLLSSIDSSLGIEERTIDSHLSQIRKNCEMLGSKK